MVYRCYTEVKPDFAVDSRLLLREFQEFLHITDIDRVRIFRRYDVEGVSSATFDAAKQIVFSDPQVEFCTDELPNMEDALVLTVEAVPGQFDQLADSCTQCIQMLVGGERPLVATAKVYAIYGANGALAEADTAKIRTYLINPVETREALTEKPETLVQIYAPAEPESIVEGFITIDDDALAELLSTYGLAMDIRDLTFMRDYYRENEKRDPTRTELRVIDTYWSDHCRHTTFNTHIDSIDISDPLVAAAFEEYQQARFEVFGDAANDRPMTLMDVATLGPKLLKKRGILTNVDESEEVNACSVRIKATVDGEEQDWLLMFKNETHNHPTEIEPFGGAATCVGGGIRDPLSGRSFVYQAMRVTGAGDPRTPFEDTVEGKLPQRKLTTTAATGFSSYGNQIGLAGGLAQEFYHDGYVAKRMEAGALVSAAPVANVVRQVPKPGDSVLLIGGRTGRDGIGGATGSSKAQNVDSFTESAAEVQKGNAPEERKLVRLFRNPEVAPLIKRCNDFGAGGVSVAIGELADGLDIDIDAVRVKYDGLAGGEIALSESQERMAVVVADEDTAKVIAEAELENLEAYVVAKVTDKNRVIMTHNGERIADISRELLASNGAAKHSSATINVMEDYSGAEFDGSPIARLKALVADLRFCSQRGIGERLDSTVGAGSVLVPFGGKTQLTPAQSMVALIPAENGNSSTCSVMSFGFDPYHSSVNTFTAARDAVIVSCAKLVAAGADIAKAHLSFQEFFERIDYNPAKWGKPLSALLGALEAQIGLEVGAIGGKDSMSGSYMDIDVPPTLVSFSIAPCEADRVLSPDFKASGNSIFLIRAGETIEQTREIWKAFRGLRANVCSAWAVTDGGPIEGIFKMAIGNNIGFEANTAAVNMLFDYLPGAIVAEFSGLSSVEVAEILPGSNMIGRTISEPEIRIGDEIASLDELVAAWESTLEDVFPTRTSSADAAVETITYEKPSVLIASEKFAKPVALIPVFPGTNGEYDAALAVRRAGGEVENVIIQNLSPEMLADSVERLVSAINKAQMLILPAGFSEGPDGFAKFIASLFRLPKVSDAIHGLIKQRDGLILGIGSGYQALLRLGLVPFGEIRDMTEDAPALAPNLIGRHQSKYVNTRISSINSPWLNLCKVGDIYNVPFSHGDARFVASDAVLANLIANGQIASQYTDADGFPSMDISVNPSGSYMAVEGLLSPDGRVFGKMGNSERRGDFVGINIPGNKHRPIFESGVAYYK